MSIPLILFAKAPIAGKVKTRLQTHCSAQQAADIAKILLSETLKNVTQHWQGRVLLSVCLNRNDPFLLQIAKQFNVEMITQVEGDLGLKMHSALNQHGYPAAVMGCDVAHCSADILQQAHQTLEHGFNAIGPSEDGGYYLLGLQNVCDPLFEGIDWGTDRVYQQTAQKAILENIQFTELPNLNDIDEWNDLLKAAQFLPTLADYLSLNKL